MIPLAVGWRPRDRPLRPLGVAAWGQPAEVLRGKLVAREDRGRFRGLGGAGWLVVLGEEPPWVDGGVFLGVDPAAPRLLLPTHSAPDVEGVPVSAWLEGSVAARCAGRGGPFAVVPALGIVAMGGAHPVHVDGLAAWGRQ